MNFGRTGALLLLLLVATLPVGALTPPSIISLAPSFGSPEGGEFVTIRGSVFTAPVRVFFDSLEVFVISQTHDAIVVVTPPHDLGALPSKDVQVTVINGAGTSQELRSVAPVPFHYERFDVEPQFAALSPNTGLTSGGMRVTIFGDAFRQPVQVFFGDEEAQVISVTEQMIVVLTPPMRDAGPIDVTIVNDAAGKATTVNGVFRYTGKSTRAIPRRRQGS